MGTGERRDTNGKYDVAEYRRYPWYFPPTRAPTFSWPFPRDTLVDPGTLPLAQERMKEVVHGRGRHSRRSYRRRWERT